MADLKEGPRRAAWQWQVGLGADVLQEGLETLAKAIMELEVEKKVGAQRHQRTPTRKTHCNNHRKRQAQAGHLLLLS